MGNKSTNHLVYLFFKFHFFVTFVSSSYTTAIDNESMVILSDSLPMITFLLRVLSPSLSDCLLLTHPRTRICSVIRYSDTLLRETVRIHFFSISVITLCHFPPPHVLFSTQLAILATNLHDISFGATIFGFPKPPSPLSCCDSFITSFIKSCFEFSDILIYFTVCLLAFMFSNKCSIFL